jgi:hypothetical protein
MASSISRELFLALMKGEPGPLFHLPRAPRDVQLTLTHAEPESWEESQCVACQAPIRWARHDGERLPVNLDGVPHAKTCMEVDKWLP